MFSLLPLLGFALAIPTVPASGAVRPVQTLGTGAPPAIRLDLSSNGAYLPSDWARVFVQAERDGYLLVVHADPMGRVRVLFPVDPVDDHFIGGGRTFEVRSRGDREAFAAGIDLGVGLVYAAWAPDPFRFDEYRRGERWDLRDLVVPAAELDMEAGLTSLVSQMAPAGGYDYDALRYVVDDTPSYATTALYDGTATSCWDCGSTSTVYVGVGIGGPWYWGGWYWPYYYPWYGYRYAYGYYPYYPPYYGGYAYYPYYGYRGGYVPGYPAYRDRYGYYGNGDVGYAGGYRFKNVNDATASGTPGWRDRGLPTQASTATGRRLPSMGESSRTPDGGGFTGRRTVTSASDASRAVRTPDATTGRRTTPAASQPVGTRQSPAGAREPQAGARDRSSATPSRRSTTGGEAQSRPATQTDRSTSAPRRSNTERSALPTDARQASGLPSRAGGTATTRQSSPSAQARQVPDRQGRAVARRVERPDRPQLQRRSEVQPRAGAGRSTSPAQRVSPSGKSSRPSASTPSRGSDRPSASPSRGGSSGRAAPSGGGGRAAPSSGGGSRSTPSGGGGRGGGRRG